MQPPTWETEAMTIDDRALHELIVESEDLQADALRDHRKVNADLEEIHQERLARGVDPDEVRFHAEQYNEARSGILKAGGVAAGVATFGAALTALMAGPAAAAGSDVDVMILQTAASLENLAVATYGAALGLDFIKNGNATVQAFAKKTREQHMAHGSAFNDTAKSLGGKAQTKTNAKYQSVVDDALPGLTDAGKVVELAPALEQVATQTYNKNCGLMMDKDAKTLMASVMG